MQTRAGTRGRWTLALALLVGCASTPARAAAPALQTVPHVDLSRYLGTWYEIARYPTRFYPVDNLALHLEYSHVTRQFLVSGPERGKEDLATARVDWAF